MKLVFSDQAWEDYLHWQASDANILERANSLIKECMRSPFRGTGKPEPTRPADCGRLPYGTFVWKNSALSAEKCFHRWGTSVS